MTPKQQYTRAYSTWRESNGSACLHSTPATRAAWATFTEKVWLKNNCDPLPINVSIYRAAYTMRYAKAKIAFLIHCSSDFHLSAVAKL